MKFLPLFLLLSFGPGYRWVQSADDELAIRDVIERETQAYLDRNASQQADCWAMHTHLSQRVSLNTGRLVVANGDQVSLRRGLETCFRQLTEPDRATFRHDEYRIRIRGEAAFVTFRQIMRPANQPAEHSQQVRYLEREQGQWKIVHSGVMYYDPTPEQVQANR
jgi:ketosteroid isomerase-like protein